LDSSSIHRRLQMAENRGFVHCLASLRDDYRWNMTSCYERWAPFRERRGPPDRTPSLGLVTRTAGPRSRVRQVEFDDSRSVLRVTTEPITLQDVDLGPFAIELVWTRLGQHRGSACSK